ncbi:S4 domain-containing protein YaaA [Streptococcus pneumoniae]|nr:S4 domain-containing protein YaaA [Streptococcus pneumoniae]
MNIDILLTQPTSEEQDEYQADKVEKERIAKLVKKMNKGVLSFRKKLDPFP